MRNVFFADSERAGKTILYAIDHTHCIRTETSLSLESFRTEAVRDATLFGLFPQLAPLIMRQQVQAFALRLRAFTLAVALEIIREIPKRWLSRELRDPLADFLVARAMFVATHVEEWMSAECPWQPVLPLEIRS